VIDNENPLYSAELCALALEKNRTLVTGKIETGDEIGDMLVERYQRLYRELYLAEFLSSQ